jgi:hypothetical protein
VQNCAPRRRVTTRIVCPRFFLFLRPIPPHNPHLRSPGG